MEAMQHEHQKSGTEPPRDDTTYSLNKILPSCHVNPPLIKRLESLINDIAILRDDNSYSGRAKIEVTIEERDGKEEFSSIDHYRRDYFPDDTKTVSVRIGSSWQNRLTIKFSLEPFTSQITVLCQSPNARSDAKRIHDQAIDVIKDYQNSNWILNPSAPLLHFIIAPVSYASFGVALATIKTSLVGASRFAILGIAIQVYTNSHRFKPYSEFKTKLNEERSKWFNWFWLVILESILLSLVLTPLIGFVLKR
jgi:hypothetical protein